MASKRKAVGDEGKQADKGKQAQADKRKQAHQQAEQDLLNRLTKPEGWIRAEDMVDAISELPEWEEDPQPMMTRRKLGIPVPKTLDEYKHEELKGEEERICGHTDDEHRELAQKLGAVFAGRSDRGKQLFGNPDILVPSYEELIPSESYMEGMSPFEKKGVKQVLDSGRLRELYEKDPRMFSWNPDSGICVYIDNNSLLPGLIMREVMLMVYDSEEGEKALADISVRGLMYLNQ